MTSRLGLHFLLHRHIAPDTSISYRPIVITSMFCREEKDLEEREAKRRAAPVTSGGSQAAAAALTGLAFPGEFQAFLAAKLTSQMQQLLMGQVLHQQGGEVQGEGKQQQQQQQEEEEGQGEGKPCAKL